MDNDCLVRQAVHIEFKFRLLVVVVQRRRRRSRRHTENASRQFRATGKDRRDAIVGRYANPCQPIRRLPRLYAKSVACQGRTAVRQNGSVVFGSLTKILHQVGEGAVMAPSF